MSQIENKQIQIVDEYTLQCVLEDTIEKWLNHYLERGMMTMPEKWQDTAASDLATCLVCELARGGLKEAAEFLDELNSNFEA